MNGNSDEPIWFIEVDNDNTACCIVPMRTINYSYERNRQIHPINFPWFRKWLRC